MSIYEKETWRLQKSDKSSLNNFEKKVLKKYMIYDLCQNVNTEEWRIWKNKELKKMC